MAAATCAIVAGMVGLPVGLGGASPGALDPAFGTNGRVAVPVGSESSYVVRLVRQTDGKLVMFGGWGLRYAGPELLLVRVTADGRADETFGQHGVVATAAPGHQSVYGGVGLVQADGKLVAMGEEITNAANNIALLRVNTDGTPDSGFGSQGWALAPAPASASGNEIVQQADGKLLVAGASNGHPAMFRVNRDGTPDTGYGNQGDAVLAPNTTASITTIHLQADGAVLVAWVENSTVVIHRVTTTGALDMTYGTNGSVSVTAPNVSMISPQLLADGGLLLETAESVPPGTGAPLHLSRHNASGQPVATFGTNGTLDLRATTFANLVHPEPQPDGSILIVGTGLTNGGTQGMFVERRTATGTLDPSFGCLGRASSGLGTDAGNTALVNPDGSIVVAGTVADRIIPVPGRSQPPDVVRDPEFVRYANPSATGACGWILDGYGGVHPYGTGGMALPPPASGGPYWGGWDIVRGVAADKAVGGLVLDGWGGLHGIQIDGRIPAQLTAGAYWNGWDIARGVALMPGGTGGYVLDGFGGLHPFAIGSNQAPPAVTNGPYWNGWDIARGVVLMPGGTGGYVLDGFGGLHPFSIGANQAPPVVTNGPYWNGWKIAHGVALTSDGWGGYVEDGWGGLQPFSIGNHAPPSNVMSGGAYWRGWEIARGVAIVS